MQTHDQVAIIGMGCIFPGANGLTQYWRLLFNGQDAITPVPETTHWKRSDYFHPDPACPDHTYCSRGGFLPRVSFDPLRYGIPPKNLEATDTSQLLGLLVADMALQDAGYGADRDFDRHRTNVILGVTGTQELVIPLGARLSHPIWEKALQDSGIAPEKQKEILQRMADGHVPWQENSFPGLLGNVVAGRIANRLNLGGTNAVVDAACASSMGAIHTACMELMTGRCDLSITGGVDTLNDIFMHMCFSKTGVLSHTSDARPFSRNADGTVLGEGVGMLVLKRLADAEKDKDRIYAVIRGVGTSSDGSTGGIYAPDAGGQLRALKDAYTRAGIAPHTVGLIEAHGTGTRVGDKVEITALKQLMAGAPVPVHCALGSVKSMIGHTKASAGIAGIIKAVLALYHKVIPPTLKADDPDPALDLNGSGLYLSSDPRPWMASPRHPRRCGVSAFGFGGSNFHTVLEEYPGGKKAVSWDGTIYIAPFCADDVAQLQDQLTAFIQQMADYSRWDDYERATAINWEVARRCNAFSSTAALRLVILLKEKEDPAKRLSRARELLQESPSTSWNREDIFFGTGRSPGRLGFVFPGQGSQYPQMGRDLIALFPEGLETLALSEKVFQQINGPGETRQLSQAIFPPPAHVQTPAESEARLKNTDMAQPAIGALSLAMVQILKRFNIVPDAVCGHSFGELCALCAARRLSLEDFFTLAASRGKHMAAAPDTDRDPGSMLAIQAPLGDIQQLLSGMQSDLILANRNSPRQGVLSGSTKGIKSARKACRKQKMRAVQLPVAAGFHSPLVAHAARPFKASLADISFAPGNIPVYANATGSPYPADPETARQLLADQLLSPVHFMENITAMARDGVTTFLEVGPRAVLSGLVKEILADTPHQRLAMDASCGRHSGIADLARILGQLAALGYPVALQHWETPSVALEKKTMRVALTGANAVHTPSSPLPPSAPVPMDRRPAASARKVSAPPADIFPKTTKGSDMTHQPPPPDRNNHPEPEKRLYPAPARDTELAYQAMALVQSGLKSLQDLQAGTTRAHEKFLETQEAAGRSLERMMTETRMFADTATQAAGRQGFGAPVAGHPPVEQSGPPVGRPPVEPAPAVPPPPPGEAVPSATAPREAAASGAAMAPPAAGHLPQDAPPLPVSPAINPTTKNNDATDSVRAKLLACVSRLTGFPEEMLEMEMHLESDLGIDSIKRVEIMSELEKSLPDHPALTPDMMADIKTLNDICTLLRRDTAPLEKNCPPSTQSGLPTAPLNGSPSANSSSGDPAAPAAQTATGTLEVMETLVKTVSDLTGFPMEMLEPSMNLESDLGVDSIKRVEIFSRLEQILPQVTALSSDEMTGMKTLAQIATRLETGPPDQALPLDSPAGTDLPADGEHLEETAPPPAEDAVPEKITAAATDPFGASALKKKF